MLSGKQSKKAGSAMRVGARHTALNGQEAVRAARGDTLREEPQTVPRLKARQDSSRSVPDLLPAWTAVRPQAARRPDRPLRQHRGRCTGQRLQQWARRTEPQLRTTAPCLPRGRLGRLIP